MSKVNRDDLGVTNGVFAVLVYVRLQTVKKNSAVIGLLNGKHCVPMTKRKVLCL